MKTKNETQKAGILSRMRFRKKRMAEVCSPYLQSRDTFKCVLEIERARAERSNSAFIFARIRLNATPGGERVQPELFGRLAKIVGERIRFTDVAGISGDGIGLIFPTTPLKEVEKVIEDIDALFRTVDAGQNGKNTVFPEMVCDIYSSELQGDTDIPDGQQEELWPQLRT